MPPTASSSTSPARRTLITGASGFIAANLIRRLLAEGHEVHALRRADSDLWRMAGIEDKIIWHAADLRDAEALMRACADAKPDWLFHLATARGDTSDGRLYYETNLVAARNLLAACRATPPQRLIVHGSSLEYGHRDQPLREDMPLQPDSHHGLSKACAGLLFLQAQRDEGLPVTLLRLFSVYGAWESRERLLIKALLAGMDGGTLGLTAPGIRRDYVHVDDVVDASLRAAVSAAAIGRAINIGSGVQTSNEGMVAMIDQLTGRRLRLLDGAYPRHASDTGHWVADTHRCREILGWTPATTLAEGLEKTLTFLQQHRNLSAYA